MKRFAQSIGTFRRKITTVDRQSVTDDRYLDDVSPNDEKRSNVKTKRTRDEYATEVERRRRVWDPFLSSTMQAALRRTSDCLFSMRSYRASCTRTSRSRTLFPIPLPPVASSSSSLPDSTAPSHQLTRTVPLHWRATSLSSFSSFLHFSRSLDSFPLLRFRCSLVHALSSSLSLSFFLSSLPILPTTIVLFLSRDDERARISARLPSFYLTVAWLFAHPWNEESVREHRLESWISRG